MIKSMVFPEKEFKLKYKDLIINCQSDENLYHLFEQLYKMFANFLAVDNLIHQATQLGPITVEFCTEREEPTGSAWYSCTRKIYVDKNINLLKLIEALIFQLCNANNPYLQQGNQFKIDPLNYADRNEFTLARELAEYTNTYIPCCQIMNALLLDTQLMKDLKESGIVIPPEEILAYQQSILPNFEVWWATHNKNIPSKDFSQTDLYRQASPNSELPNPKRMKPN